MFVLRGTDWGLICQANLPHPWHIMNPRQSFGATLMSCLFNAQESQFNGLPTTMYQNQRRVTGSVGDLLCHWRYCLYRINTLLCAVLYYSYRTLHSDTSGHRMYGRFSPASNSLQYQLDILQFNSFWHCLGITSDATVKGSVPQNCPCPIQRPISSHGSLPDF